MNKASQRSNAEVLDVLYAVALGEGFISGIYGLKAQIISGEILMFAEAGQELCRVLLAFVVLFALLAVSASAYGGSRAEWVRLLLVTVAISAFRPLDRKFLPAA